MKTIIAISALAMFGGAHADPYSGQSGKTIQEVIVYLSDNTGRTAVSTGNVIGGDFLACFAKWEELPKVRCYRMTGEAGVIEQVRITEAVETTLLQGKGS